MASVPQGLRRWFIAHFVLDSVFALGLLAIPGTVLGALGFASTDFVFARLVGAALVAIGGTSLFMRNKSAEAYTAMLVLKLLWSGSAIAAIGISLSEGAPASASVFLVIFILFFMIWAYYLNRIKERP